MGTVRKILLLDDEPSVLLALKLVLKALKFEVQEFSQPELALNFLKDSAQSDPKTAPVDLVLSDLKMPGLNGFEMLRETRLIYPELKFVLMSAHATREDVARAKELGSNGYLAKPFDPRQLREVLEGLGANSG